MKKNILFIFPGAFTHAGGIESFDRAFIKALENIMLLNKELDVKYFSLVDKNTNPVYVRPEKVTFFSGNRKEFFLKTFASFLDTQILIVGHVNFSLLAVLFKLLLPFRKLIYITHGIEVWSQLSWVQRIGLKLSDEIWSVSNFTKSKLVEKGLQPEKIRIFPNTLDPSFQFPKTFFKKEDLLNKFGIQTQQPVILTLARLSFTEKNKGYDNVIRALPKVLAAFPNALYLMAGKYDEREKKRLEVIAEEGGVSKSLIFTNFVPNNEITSYYQLADVFIMPSKKEGFGIVYLEAMACGVPVIAGNVDGSVDALANGEIGFLINPDDIEEIANQIIFVLNHKDKIDKTQSAFLQNAVIQKFGFEAFTNRLKTNLGL